MKNLAVVDRRNEGVQLVPVETVKFCSDEMILTRHDKPSVDTSTSEGVQPITW